MFGIKRYEMLLEEISLNNCEFSTEWTQETNPNTIFLRHDIDFSIQDALIIAEKEKKLGVKSTFFFMLTSNMYNIFSSFHWSGLRLLFFMGGGLPPSSRGCATCSNPAGSIQIELSPSTSKR